MEKPYFLDLSFIDRKLDEMLNSHLVLSPIWECEFFQVLQNEDADSTDVWRMLCVWTENMIGASYGFQGYVLHLAARSEHEEIRRLLVMNAFEELGDLEYPSRSHFQMVRNLAGLVGLSDHEIETPRLLPTSVAHIETHLERCRNPKTSFFHALGMIYLIENLTRLEFEKVLTGFVDWWEEGTGRKLSEFAIANGVSYFSANMEADDGHAEDVAEMIMVALESLVVKAGAGEESVSHAISEIERGISESISLRNGFLNGCFYEVFPE